MSATMSDIAAKAGTSVAAVSVALNGARSKTLKMSPETRGRILSAAEELGYRRNPHANALATGQSRMIGLMLPTSSAFARHDPFYSLITTGISSCAADHGFNVMLYTAASEDDGERAARMIDKLCAGLIFVSAPVDTPLFKECRRQRIPFASIIGEPDGAPITVNSDDYRGGLLATRHLLSLGHKRIAHLSGRPEIVTSKPRREGYLDALKEAGIEPDPSLCIRGDFNRDASRLVSLDLVSDYRPTAIFAGNDLSAHGVLDALSELGLSAPGDVAVVGYDDTWYATVTRPTLTSVNMDAPRMGYLAAEALLSSIAGDGASEAHLVLPVTLTVRESCGAEAP